VRRKRQAPFFFAIPRPDWLRPRLAPTVVQHKAAHSVTSTSITWNSSTTAGNLLVVFAGALTDLDAASAIATPSGWTKAAGPGSSSFVTAYCFYKENAASQSSTPTFSAAGSGDAIALFGFEIGGDLAGATGTLDKTATANGNGAAQVTGTTATTTQAAEIWLAAIFNDLTTTPTSPTNGFTLQDTVSAQFATGGDFAVSAGSLSKIVAATGAASSGFTANGNYQGVIATFKGTALTTKAEEFLQRRASRYEYRDYETPEVLL
jgi:hypothetical protein